jgi:hypothetical protein
VVASKRFYVDRGLAVAKSYSRVPLIGGLGWRKARQRRVAKALEIDTPNEIVEQRFVRVGGIDQWIQIRGEDRDHPVLLVLHGGPGWPNAVFTLPLRPWEQHFTVVQWDHRGQDPRPQRQGRQRPDDLRAKGRRRGRANRVPP